VLFDDVRLTLFDAFESVCEVEAVADLFCSRVNQVELGRVREPAGDECRGIGGSGALANARRDKRAKLDFGREARRDRPLILSSYGLNEPCPDRGRHALRV